LSQNNEADNAELAELRIPRIDLVYVNMYPLAEEIAKPDHTLASVIEKTDIGGPTMLRSAAKGRRIVMCQPSQIDRVMEEIIARDFVNGKEMKISFISKLVHEAEKAVGEYCTASSEFHRQVARDAEFTEN